MHSGPSPTHKAPSDDGVQLATLHRGSHKQLRIRWREYRGFHYLDLREWSLSKDGMAWWPTKTGLTIKQRELVDVLKALETARGLL